MKISRSIVFLWFTLTSKLLQAQISWPAELIITPEKSEFLKTSTYKDVGNFLEQLKLRTKEIQLISLGKSYEGKQIPVAVLSRQSVSHAAEAKASGKPAIYIQGNIPSGEVEGKKGSFTQVKQKFKKGDYVVELAQPLANLIFYLLEPQSDDGLVTWNFFDYYHDKQGVNNKPVQYPVFKYYIKKYNHG